MTTGRTAATMIVRATSVPVARETQSVDSARSETSELIPEHGCETTNAKPDPWSTKPSCQTPR